MICRIRFYLIITIAFCLSYTSICQADSTVSILILSSKGAVFDKVIEGLSGELGTSYILKTVTLSDDVDSAGLKMDLENKMYSLIILMGNRAIRLYKTFLQKRYAESGNTPVVSLVASNMDFVTKDIKNINGIAYEIPMITSLIGFRSIVNKKIMRVGVLHRAIFESMVKKQKEYCKSEKIELKSIMISDEIKKYHKEIKNALNDLVKKEHVDVFWIPNDNIILQPDLLGDIWIPFFSRYKIPVIVGVESLVKPELNFGTYAVIPDPKALGEQAAELVITCEESGWQFENDKIDPPISVYTTLNLTKFESIFNKIEPNTNNVNKILQLNQSPDD